MAEPIVPKTFEVPVGGLHCAGCVQRLTKVLSAQPGVVAAEVSLSTGRARLEVLSAEALPGAVAAVEGAGFYPGSPAAV